MSPYKKMSRAKPSLFTHQLIHFAKVLHPWRNAFLILALGVLALSFIAAFSENAVLLTLQSPSLVMSLWLLIGYFYIASFAHFNEQLPSNATFFMRVKHKIANLFAKIMMLIILLMLLASLFLGFRLLRVWLG